ncbi:MAG TPA: biopolymer transporter ExbD [Candidatus Baltobacteraceae bacterium]|jgi:biopolymer transport protein ExbD|nr:biopolymer transporter ExbD [Candidatus Baltobacteraceae bacterium]
MAFISCRSDDEVMSTINITPFTDVLLVLLIIFIILTSVTKEPRLPTARNTKVVENSEIVVLIDAKNRIEVGSKIVDIAQAPAAFRRLADATGHRYQSVIIKADPDASYGIVLQVMDAAKNADLTSFGLANREIGAK